MELGVARAIRALDSTDRPTLNFTPLHKGNISFIFSALRATHTNIRKMLGAAWEQPGGVDSLALARLQLEGLYTLSLMFESPANVDIYLRDGWRQMYIDFLLQREETQGLDRFQGFLTTQGPTSLEAQRHLLGITVAEKATIEHDEIGTPLPPGVRPIRIPRFPTPGRVVNRLPQGDRRRCLERLYPEYRTLCTFAHGLAGSNVLKQMFNKGTSIQIRDCWSDAQITDAFQREVAEKSFVLSLLAVNQAVAELTTIYPNDVELRVASVQAWQEIERGTLLGKTVWQLRTKTLLGVM